MKILKSVYLAQMLKRNVIGAVSRNNVIVTHENSPGFSQSIFNRGIRCGIQERRCR